MTDTYDEEIERAIAEVHRKREEKQFRQRVLESDEAMTEWLKQHGPFDRRVPITRRSVYGERGIHDRQELFPHDERTDMRRPVIMRGAYYFIISGSHDARKLVKRYLRMKRYTCFDKKENTEILMRVDRLVSQHLSKHGLHACTRHVGLIDSSEFTVDWFPADAWMPKGCCSVWVNGIHYAGLETNSKPLPMEIPLPRVVREVTTTTRSAKKATIVMRALRELGVDI